MTSSRSSRGLARASRGPPLRRRRATRCTAEHRQIRKRHPPSSRARGARREEFSKDCGLYRSFGTEVRPSSAARASPPVTGERLRLLKRLAHREPSLALLALGLCAASLAGCGGSKPESSRSCQSSSGGSGRRGAGRVRPGGVCARTASTSRTTRVKAEARATSTARSSGGNRGPCKEFRSEGSGNV